ncbi:hypothetical protein CXG81DRAFT_27052 [Caulochytrium protostelioides]|uniref:Origin recognition complex subunit 6 n=1 Tax=Caulochytrium protostelioides TaxID=1555241 RepID=A0A4P9X551_9FUNG|nr:hypothetical protein CXG81DRAFT_27052 [Caulochytrium protostelioides]|eukprot:RKP00233.1 hypothetical protein CXG81DRAFT_27052 [Caulochytrium protostelioides]
MAENVVELLHRQLEGVRAPAVVQQAQDLHHALLKLSPHANDMTGARVAAVIALDITCRAALARAAATRLATDAAMPARKDALDVLHLSEPVFRRYAEGVLNAIPMASPLHRYFPPPSIAAVATRLGANTRLPVAPLTAIHDAMAAALGPQNVPATRHTLPLAVCAAACDALGIKVPPSRLLQHAVAPSRTLQHLTQLVAQRHGDALAQLALAPPPAAAAAATAATARRPAAAATARRPAAAATKAAKVKTLVGGTKRARAAATAAAAAPTTNAANGPEVADAAAPAAAADAAATADAADQKPVPARRGRRAPGRPKGAGARGVTVVAPSARPPAMALMMDAPSAERLRARTAAWTARLAALCDARLAALAPAAA